MRWFWWTGGSQPFSLQAATNNNRPGNDAQTKEIEELKKKLAAKTQDLGAFSAILYPLSPAVDDCEQMP